MLLEFAVSDRASDWLRHSTDSARLRVLLHARQVQVFGRYQTNDELLGYYNEKAKKIN